FSLLLFTFTTILGWSYIGERCWSYLFGIKTILPFRIFWVVAVYAGATAQLELVWAIADILNGLMAVPNLIALILLSPVVVGLTKSYFANRSVEEVGREKN